MYQTVKWRGHKPLYQTVNLRGLYKPYQMFKWHLMSFETMYLWRTLSLEGGCLNVRCLELVRVHSLVLGIFIMLTKLLGIQVLLLGFVWLWIVCFSLWPNSLFWVKHERGTCFSGEGNIWISFVPHKRLTTKSYLFSLSENKTFPYLLT